MKILLLLLCIALFGCNTIPINAKGCYIDPKTGLHACATYGSTSGVGVEVDFKSVK